jgi:hypothetical protein
MDLEKARLPESQEDALRYRIAKEFVEQVNPRIKAIWQSIRDLPSSKQYYDIKKAFNGLIHPLHDTSMAAGENPSPAVMHTRILEWNTRRRKLEREMSDAYSRYKKDSEEPMKQLQALQSNQYLRAERLVQTYGHIATRQTGDQTAVEEKKAWTFVMKCSVSDCQGFVGMNWKCGLCEMTFCKECQEPTSLAKHEARQESEKPESSHECDSVKVLSVKALMKEAKPCPKCAAMISKIDGCDQMWCTQCQTAFSWNTGSIESRIHNPHYFEWVRRTGGNLPPPPPVQGDGVCLTNDEILRNAMFYLREQHTLMEHIRRLNHANESYLSRARGEVRYNQHEHPQKKRVLRVRRLVNEIDDTAWKVALQKMEKAENKGHRVYEVVDMYVQAGFDILRIAIQDSADKESCIQQFATLHTYANEQLMKLGRRFGSFVDILP